MGITAVAFISLQQHQLKSNNYLEFQLKKVQLENSLLSQVLNDPNNCSCLFQGSPAIPQNPPAPGATLSGVTPNQIGRYRFVTPGDCSTATIPQPLVQSTGQEGVRSSAILLKNIQNISGAYSGELEVQLESLKPVAGPKNLSIRIPVNIGVTLAGGLATFRDCSINTTPPPPTPTAMACQTVLTTQTISRDTVVRTSCPLGTTLAGGNCWAHSFESGSNRYENLFLQKWRDMPSGNGWECGWRMNTGSVEVRTYSFCCGAP
jgi:hypothetical protein